MLIDEQYKLMAITDTSILLSRKNGECLSIPLNKIENAPIKLCSISFRLGWASAKNSSHQEIRSA